MCAQYTICTLCMYVCMYVYTVCMCILYIQYMYSMCAREYNVCVCVVVTYILVILRSSSAVVRASFSSLNSFNNISLHSSASAQHTHTQTLTYHTILDHSHIFTITYIHSHHIHIYVRPVHVCIVHVHNESTKVQNPRRNSYAGLTFNSSWLRSHIHYTSVVYCACACECLAAPSRPSPVSRLFHAGCTSS